MLGTLSKAIGAGIGGGMATVGLTTIVPPEVETPWWGYLIVYAVGIIVPAVVTYFMPKNSPPS